MDFNQENKDIPVEEETLSHASQEELTQPSPQPQEVEPPTPEAEPSAPEADSPAPEAEPVAAPKEPQVPKKDSHASPKVSAAPVAAPPSAQESEKEKRKKHRLRTQKYWKKRRRRRARHRRFRRFLFFMLAFLIGIAVAYGAIAAAAYFVVGGLTIDTLQKFGMAEGADQYLTANGDVDLTDTTLLELVRDLQSVGGQLGSFSLDTLMQHYGLVLPEEMVKVLPSDLMAVPLDTLFADVGNTVTETLTVGYVLSFLPEGMMDPRIIEAISPRPLSMLTNGEFGKLLEGVKMGYFFGVAYDENGNVQYANPEVPTFQEVLAPLDLGIFVGALTTNGDLLAVFANQLGEVDAGAFLKGITEGALTDAMIDGKLVKDIILLNAETGRYELSFPAFVKGLSFGNAMGYELVGDTWYSEYTDNGDDTDDVAVGGLLAVLSGISLEDAINKNLDLIAIFSDLYFGDLQDGYTRGEPVYSTPEGDEPAELIGYTWFKDGETIPEMQNAIANIAVSDLLGGTFNWQNAMSGLLVGDAAGYLRGELITPADPADPTSRPQYAFSKPGASSEAPRVEIAGAMLELSNIPLADLLEGKADLTSIVSSLKVAELLEFTYHDGTYYSTFSDDDDPTNDIKVTGVLAALADKRFEEINVATINGIKIGDLLGYVLVDTDEDGTPDTWYDEQNQPVKGVLARMADNTVDTFSHGDTLLDTLHSIPLADLLDYEKHGDKYYSKYDPEDPANNVEVKGILAALADKPIDQITSDTVFGLSLGVALGYEERADGWYKQSALGVDEKAHGILAALLDKSVGSVNSDTLSGMSVGEAMGFVLDEGVWYHADGVTPVTGITLAIADLTIAELDDPDRMIDAIHTVSLGTALGHQKGADGWYTQPEDPNEEPTKITGMIGVLADYKIGELESKIMDVELGHVLGYEKVGEVWYTAYDPAAPESGKATGITNALADTKLCDLGSSMQTLTIEDVLPERTGVLALIDGTTKLNSLNSACQTAFSNATMGDLVAKGVISLSLQHTEKLDSLFALSGKNWRMMTINVFFAEMLDALP